MGFIPLMIYHLLLFEGLIKSFIKFTLSSFKFLKNVMSLVDGKYVTNLLSIRHKI